ncbi:MAG TPA: hypothetical protein VMY78_03675 [Solirubrobacteraceae bacterium]|nr:hypothetical protein [Solirubrobacteraceae bacterium]
MDLAIALAAQGQTSKVTGMLGALAGFHVVDPLFFKLDPREPRAPSSGGP